MKTPAEKSVMLTDEQVAQVSGGNTLLSYEDVTHKYCSEFRSTESARLAGDETHCKSCQYLLIVGDNYYCTKDKKPTMQP
ncbi:MAG: hypothetical protein KBT31_03870 [Firmicutes bacterium]|nr:hypothetical protein [Candidatus Colimorpha enterica]